MIPSEGRRKRGTDEKEHSSHCTDRGTGAAMADEAQPIMLPEFVTQDTAASADEAGALVPALFLIFMVLGSS